VSKKGQTNFDDVSMLPFRRTILLMGMRTRDHMHDTNFGEKGIQFFIFSYPVTLNRDNFAIKESLN
jgi:hypothetical protein